MLKDIVKYQIVLFCSEVYTPYFFALHVVLCPVFVLRVGKLIQVIILTMIVTCTTLERRLSLFWIGGILGRCLCDNTWTNIGDKT